jgi:hypothetical protein
VANSEPLLPPAKKPRKSSLGNLPNQVVFHNIFAVSFYDSDTHSLRVRPMEGQKVNANLTIKCSAKLRRLYPAGTIYKLNVRLVRERNKKPYLVALKLDELNRAIEYFEHNLRLQKGQEHFM